MRSFRSFLVLTLVLTLSVAGLGFAAGGSDDGEAQTLAQDQSKHFRAPGSERHAHGDFVTAPRD